MSLIHNHKEGAQIIADAIRDGLGRISDNFATAAEDDANGKHPANVADGLFAVAWAINRLAAAGETFTAGCVRNCQARQVGG